MPTNPEPMTERIATDETKMMIQTELEAETVEQ